LQCIEEETVTVNSSRSKIGLSQSAQLGKIVGQVLPPLVALVILLTIWQILRPDGSTGLPGPIQVWKETFDPFIINPFFDRGGNNKGLGLQVAASLVRVLQGFSLAAIVGISVGMLVGSNKLLFRAIDPIFQVLRTVPPLAWLPLSQVVFVKNEPSAIFVIFITSVWPILINTIVGVQQIPQDYINVQRVLKLSNRTFVTKILIPAALPYIFTGLRIGIGLSWLAIVAAEMIIGGVGIGFFIFDSYTNALMSQIIIGLVYVGLVGFVLDRLVGWVGSRIVVQDPK
jgi:nitrate/nitrite transport system permease protein